MVYFLIPVYNEEGNLERLHRDTLEYMEAIGRGDCSFIFVDDGSTDDSLALLRGLVDGDGGAVVLSHFPNAGVRRSFMDGFAEFLRIGGPGDVLVTKEADNTSDNAVLGRMLDAVEGDGVDVALASCYAAGGGVESTTLSRRFLSGCANSLIKVRFGLWGLHTFSSFYRAFRFEALKTAFERDSELMTCEGFACVVEMLVKLHRMGFRIAEVPMVLRSSERVGESKMPIVKTTREYIKLCVRGV